MFVVCISQRLRGIKINFHTYIRTCACYLTTQRFMQMNNLLNAFLKVYMVVPTYCYDSIDAVEVDAVECVA